MATIGGPSRRWQVGLSGTALLAAGKEGADAYGGRDTRKQAIIHALTILGGAGVLAAFWH